MPAAFTAERFAAAPILDAGSRIDRVAGVITGVRVVGLRSKNGRKYPAAVLARHAALYAAPVNVDHHVNWETMQPLPVPTPARFGRIADPKADAKGLVGNLRYNPEHAFAKPFLWAVEHDPAQYSFSPLHRCGWAAAPDADGDLVAESVREVASNDIVSDGGTTSTVFESDHSKGKTMAGKMYDAAEIAGSFETAGAAIAFVTDLFGSEAFKGYDQGTKDTLLSVVGTALAAVTADPAADPMAVPAVMESLRRLGRRMPGVRWAAERLDFYLAAEAARKKAEWAADLVAAEGLPEGLRSDFFVSLVAEHHAHPDRAKALIQDRMAVGAGRSGGGPQTYPSAGAKTVKDLVDGYAIG